MSFASKNLQEAWEAVCEWEKEHGPVSLPNSAGPFSLLTNNLERNLTLGSNAQPLSGSLPTSGSQPPSGSEEDLGMPPTRLEAPPRPLTASSPVLNHGSHALFGAPLVAAGPTALPSQPPSGFMRSHLTAAHSLTAVTIPPPGALGSYTTLPTPTVDSAPVTSPSRPRASTAPSRVSPTAQAAAQAATLAYTDKPSQPTGNSGPTDPQGSLASLASMTSMASMTSLASLSVAAAPVPTTPDGQYVCEVEGCKKRFARVHNLRSHQLIHTDERGFPCTFPGCALAFRRSHDLKRHLRLHTGENPYTCPHCVQGFTRSDALLRHTKSQCPALYPKIGAKGAVRRPRSSSTSSSQIRLYGEDESWGGRSTNLPAPGLPAGMGTSPLGGEFLNLSLTALSVSPVSSLATPEAFGGQSLWPQTDDGQCAPLLVGGKVLPGSVGHQGALGGQGGLLSSSTANLHPLWGTGLMPGGTTGGGLLKAGHVLPSMQLQGLRDAEGGNGRSGLYPHQGPGH